MPAEARSDKTLAVSKNTLEEITRETGVIGLPEKGSRLELQGEIDKFEGTKKVDPEAGRGRFNLEKFRKGLKLIPSQLAKGGKGKEVFDTLLSPVKGLREQAKDYSKAQDAVFGTPMVSMGALRALGEAIPGDADELALELATMIPGGNLATYPGRMIMQVSQRQSGFGRAFADLWKDSTMREAIQAVDPTAAFTDGILHFSEQRADELQRVLKEMFAGSKWEPALKLPFKKGRITKGKGIDAYTIDKNKVKSLDEDIRTQQEILNRSGEGYRGGRMGITAGNARIGQDLIQLKPLNDFDLIEGVTGREAILQARSQLFKDLTPQSTQYWADAITHRNLPRADVSAMTPDSRARAEAFDEALLFLEENQPALYAEALAVSNTRRAVRAASSGTREGHLAVIANYQRFNITGNTAADMSNLTDSALGDFSARIGESLSSGRSVPQDYIDWMSGARELPAGVFREAIEESTAMNIPIANEAMLDQLMDLRRNDSSFPDGVSIDTDNMRVDVPAEFIGQFYYYLRIIGNEEGIGNLPSGWAEFVSGSEDLIPFAPVDEVVSAFSREQLETLPEVTLQVGNSDLRLVFDEARDQFDTIHMSPEAALASLNDFVRSGEDAAVHYAGNFDESGVRALNDFARRYADMHLSDDPVDFVQSIVDETENLYRALAEVSPDMTRDNWADWGDSAVSVDAWNAMRNMANEFPDASGDALQQLGIDITNAQGQIGEWTPANGGEFTRAYDEFTEAFRADRVGDEFNGITPLEGSEILTEGTASRRERGISDFDLPFDHLDAVIEDMSGSLPMENLIEREMFSQGARFIERDLGWRENVAELARAISNMTGAERPEAVQRDFDMAVEYIESVGSATSMTGRQASEQAQNAIDGDFARIDGVDYYDEAVGEVQAADFSPDQEEVSAQLRDLMGSRWMQDSSEEELQRAYTWMEDNPGRDPEVLSEAIDADRAVLREQAENPTPFEDDPENWFADAIAEEAGEVQPFRAPLGDAHRLVIGHQATEAIQGLTRLPGGVSFVDAPGGRGSMDIVIERGSEIGVIDTIEDMLTGNTNRQENAQLGELLSLVLRESVEVRAEAGYVFRRDVAEFLERQINEVSEIDIDLVRYSQGERVEPSRRNLEPLDADETAAMEELDARLRAAREGSAEVGEGLESVEDRIARLVDRVQQGPSSSADGPRSLRADDAAPIEQDFPTSTQGTQAAPVEEGTIPRISGSDPRMERLDGGFRNGRLTLGAENISFLDDFLSDMDSLPSSVRISENGQTIVADSADLDLILDHLEDLVLQDLTANFLETESREAINSIVTTLQQQLGR